jgi:hypothetical protein
MASWPVLVSTDAFGRGPPSEEPAFARSRMAWVSGSLLVRRSEASSNFGRETTLGTPCGAGDQ